MAGGSGSGLQRGPEKPLPVAKQEAMETDDAEKQPENYGQRTTS